MLFNSVEFAIFLPIVFLFYWFVANRHLKAQNAFLVVVSYFFYGWWDWRFLSLIIFSSIVDFCVGLSLSKTEEKSKRKLLLFLSLFVNIGLLGFFKYFNFFIESFADAFTLLGRPMEANRLNIILPIGISFYTFQTLGYSIDVYKRKMEPVRDPIAFFAFVSFFPQLVAGPIERATNLLPQFLYKKEFKYENAVEGVRQILWGLFKKIVIADTCAVYVNDIFSNSIDYSGSTLFLGAFLFAFQIYGDFSGYSDIAIGTARLFSFKLMQNFAFPYFSRDIAEFWRRWHISLSTWFRDYVYIPLGGSRSSTATKIRNIFIIFLVSGLWHGANWTFLVWGFINACYFLPLMLLKVNRRNTNTVAEGRLFPSVRELFSMGITFAITLLAWVFFRAENISQAVFIIQKIFSPDIFQVPDALSLSYITILHFSLIILFVFIEWINRNEKFGLARMPSTIIMRRSIYIMLILFILFFGDYYAKHEFIYFQF